MSDLDSLRTDYEKAETKAQQLMADKDDAIAKVWAKYGDQLKAANQDAAEKQKALCDAEAADALRDRPDGPAVAAALGLEL